MSTTTNPRSADEVIKRLKLAFATDDEVALCLKLNRDEGTLRTWRNRDFIPATVLMQAAEATDYSFEWLKGDPNAPKMRSAVKTPEDDRTKTALTEQELVMITRFRLLPDRLRHHVQDSLLLAFLSWQDRKSFQSHETELASGF